MSDRNSLGAGPRPYMNPYLAGTLLGGRGTGSSLPGLFRSLALTSAMFECLGN